MEKVTETTFKDLQQDERYKRLERTLKMVLLKNNDTSNGNPSAWPSISSINADNLDTSCAQSVQSSRFGSEIVSSSLNLRNILSHKKSSFPPRHNLATSSENQFPIGKDDDDDDGVIMPPPKTPAPSAGRRKKFGAEIKRTPLLNVSTNLDGKENGSARSVPPTDSRTVSQCSPPTGENPISNLGVKNDFHRRNVVDESERERRFVEHRERIFSGWRVLLNDKAQLIIKGTLECGKTARSKPVIRRLAATSVQSIFKHTYRLRGNLVDERNELPDYVRGKFYNGFPDDWENVYQVWRNYVSDGSKLSFRWPTPITDSDDDIKSEITEISYRPSFEKLKKSRSPHKRRKYSTKLSPMCLSARKIDDNRAKKNQCSVLRSDALPTRISHENSSRSSENLSEGNKSLRETSFDGNQRVANNSLKDIIQEDKLNIIIDNLTNKNCSMEYIQKIVEMFDCMKYLVSYRTTDESNDSEGRSKNLEGSSTRGTKSRPIEETRNTVVSLASVSRLENHRACLVADDARRKFTINDYGSQDSDDDLFVTRRRSSFIDGRSNEKTTRQPRALDDSRPSPRIEQRYRDDERFRVGAEKSPMLLQIFNTKDSRDSPVIAHPRKSEIARNSFYKSLDRYDSSISLTEDENVGDYMTMRESRKKVKTTLANYDSSVSITEDETRGDVLRDGQRGPMKYGDRSNRSSIDSGIDRKPPDRRNFFKASNMVGTIATTENVPTSGDRSEDLSREHREDSAYLSLDANRQRGLNTIGTVDRAETESNRTRQMDFRCDFDDASLAANKLLLQQVKKKPVVVASEPANIDIRKYCTINENGNDIGEKKPHLLTERLVSHESSDDMRIIQKEQPISANKGNVNEGNSKTDGGDENFDKVKVSPPPPLPPPPPHESLRAKFGSENNPKKLTGWVPAVICEDGHSKCRLVFEGKLINEAGHVANRKFTTDFVKRRVNAKLIETMDHVFYQLVGDLNDTKHVVPKDLIKQCHNGCPSKINHFCEKWKSLSSVNDENPSDVRLHNTSVDCLSVPTSSRGRRLLPPLNYWTGERVTTKDNKAIYNPGNCQEPSITSSLEKTNEDISSDGKSPRARTRRFPNREAKEKRADVPGLDAIANEEDMIKSSSPTKLSPRRTRNGKRRLVRPMLHDSSSESDEVEKKSKLSLRKRSLRAANDAAPSARSTSKPKLINLGKNSASSQSLEQSTSSISFEKPAASDAKLKSRKRQKINQDQGQTVIAGTLKQMPTRGSSEVTCTLYRNVPLRSGDLSEDQLSTI